MRWKQFRRRVFGGGPRVIVRRHVSWPLRWALAALVLGLCAALAVWTYEVTRRHLTLRFGGEVLSAEQIVERQEVLARLRRERDQAQSIADTADSLLAAERTTQERLAEQLRGAEAEIQALRADLGFYERLLPAPGEGVAIRGFQVEASAPGQLQYLLLVTQSGKARPDFAGRYDLTVTGLLDGKPWSQAAIGGSRPFVLKTSARLEGTIDVPVNVVVKLVQARVLDAGGVVRSAQQAKFR
jgi:multidrug efflux pump subunit AcrA (membrane-fusion protein)